LTLNAILRETTPTTMMQSHCRTLAKGRMPRRSMSYSALLACMNSGPQQPVTKCMGQMEYLRAHPATKSTTL
jgi:hypothetical protein